MTIRKLFEPNSVAVVGASRDEEKLGHLIVKNLKEADFEGKIYPVNPEADEILGLKCYPSLEEAPKKTQLAVIVIPAEKVSGVLEQCEENNVSNAIVVSGGFSEHDEGGEELEEELKSLVETEKRKFINMENVDGFKIPEFLIEKNVSYKEIEDEDGELNSADLGRCLQIENRIEELNEQIYELQRDKSVYGKYID